MEILIPIAFFVAILLEICEQVYRIWLKLKGEDSGQATFLERHCPDNK